MASGIQIRTLRVAARPSELVGGTPLLDLTGFLNSDQGTKLYGKMESLGPCSSVKDRLGRSMIDQAEKDGLQGIVQESQVLIYIYGKNLQK